MREEYILERARHEVAERRRSDLEQRWGGWKRWVLPLLAGIALLAFFVVPGTVPAKLFWLMSGVCGLRPGHSYFAGAAQLPLEARMLGIYGGAMVSALLLLARGRWGAHRLASRQVLGLLGALFGSMVVDGINSTLMELQLPHLYTTTNPIRLITGLLAGAALAPFMIWLAGAVLFPKATVARPAVIGGARDLALLLAASGVFGLAMVSGQSWLYYPLAVLGVSGIVVSLTVVLLLPIVTVTDIAGRVTHVRQLVAPGALALLLTFGVVAGLALLRSATGAPLH